MKVMGKSRGSQWTSDHELHRHNADTTSESRLWRKCLIRAIYDAAYGSPSRRLGIMKWMDHEDFDTVCHFAAANPDFIHQEMCRILAAPRAVRMVLASALKSAIYAKDNDKTEDDLTSATPGDLLEAP